MDERARRIAALSPKQRAILARRRRAKVAPAVARGIPRRSSNEPARLSFGQERLWFFDRWHPGSSLYNLPTPVRLRGPLDAAALAGALRQVLVRHEVLRTALTEVAGVPYQTAGAVPSVVLPTIDLSALPRARAEHVARSLDREESRWPFDLSQGLMLRSRLFRLAATEHLLSLVVHHVASDLWSSRVLIEEVGQLYSRIRSGGPAPLPALAIQYSDFAAWQRETLKGSVFETHWASWQRRLSGAPFVLELPTDRPRPPAATFRGTSHHFVLPPAIVTAVKALAQSSNATLFMTLLAVFEILVQRLTGLEDFLVGSPVAGRTQPDLEPLIGFFVNTLPIRADLSGAPDVRQVVERVRATTLEALAHQELPFERLVELLQPERDLSRPPLVQVLFAVQNATAQRLEVSDLTLIPVEPETTTAQFDLSLLLVETPEALVGTCRFRTELFDTTTIQRMMGHFARLLTAAATAPQTPIANLAAIGASERHQLLTEWGTARPAADPRAPEGGVDASPCLHQLFEAQARRTPHAIAVSAEDRSLSYRELDRRAERLAEHLRLRGLAPDSPVAIATERSLDMVIAALAVLKADGAYLPLDPVHPKAHLAALVREVRPVAVLASGVDLDHLPADAEAVMRIDAAVTLPAAPHRNRSKQPMARAKNLAYVIATSGSTGRPKGVMCPHRAIVNQLRERQSLHPLDTTDRFLQQAAFSFEMSAWEIFWPLSTGSCLVLARPGGEKDPKYLSAAVADLAITALRFTPSMLALLLEYPRIDRWQHLRHVFTGAESMPPETMERYAQQLPGQLHHLYGPTETCVIVTGFQGHPDKKRSRVPIGRPIAGARLEVLDADQQPVAIGGVGELSIGGPGLTRGYFAQPARTAERFVPGQRWGCGERRYRTGDRVRWLADGLLDFMGRVDDQVKVRGFRVELGHVESTLRKHAHVGDAAVLMRDGGVSSQLVAYVESPGLDESHAAESELREYLLRHLPEYMVPSRFVTLESLPRNRNGKLDRHALPSPEPAPSADSRSLQTPTEQLLAEIWSEVLQLESVGPDDNFFALGGHSLIATRVIARIHRVFGVELSLQSLFENPTLAELAKQLATAEAGTQAPPISRADRDQPLPLSFAQERLWFLEQLDLGSAAYHIPLALRLQGTLRVGAFERSLHGVVERHEALRTTFLDTGEQPQQCVDSPRARSLPIVDLSALDPERREPVAETLLLAEAHRPFDLESGPLIRPLLLHLGPEDHLACFIVHHIVADGWSLGILVREVAALYRARLAGRSADLKPLPIQYVDFASWQRQWLQGEILEKQTAYWRTQLADLPVLELPTDRPRSAQASYRSAYLPLHLEPSLVEPLHQLTRDAGVTFFMTLLAGFTTLLGRWAGQQDVAIGTPIAGRTLLETEGLIGFFVNTLVLRANLRDTPSFHALLQQLRATTLQAFEHQDVPFEKLVEELNPDRALGTNPFFRTMLALQNTREELPELPDLEIENHAIAGRTAKFDLTLSFAETPGAGLAGNLEYNTDLYDETHLRRFGGHLLSLLEAAVRDPEQPLGDLDWLRMAERRQLLTEWTDTAATFDLERTVVQDVRARTISHRDAVAVVNADGEALSYGHLARRAQALAHRLKALGCGPETRVGLLLERSTELVVAALATLEAASAYVPVDPIAPAERVRYILKDANVAVLLTTSHHTHLSAGLSAETLDLKTLDLRTPDLKTADTGTLAGDSRALARVSATDPPSLPWPRADHIAYTIYTSGSTGQPKGTELAHRGLTNLVAWHLAEFKLTETDHTTQVASPGFDAAVWEVWPTLAAGATLHIPRQETLVDVERLLEWLSARQVSHSFLPTPLAEALLQVLLARNVDDPPAVSALRLVLTGGDRLHAHPTDALPFELINCYGPTEATVVSTATRIAPSGAPKTPSIGRPLPNLQALLVDRRLQPVPLGAAGELCIAGVALARGYLRRATLTAERFIPNPFAANSLDDRLYRTGDLARWRIDGHLDFLGRIDHQIKIRGFRIELNEIESVLTQLPQVEAATVRVCEVRPGLKQLVGYVVPSVGRVAPSLQALQGELRRRLPEYMVPTALMILDHLPLNANGKIDRAALPTPETDGDRQQTPPRTPTEQGLAGIWEEVLAVENVDLEDNFFDLGGHSLLATQVASRIRHRLGVEVPLRSLFEATVLKHLAHEVDQLMGDTSMAGGPDETPPIPRLDRDQLLALSFAQERLWFLDQLETGSAAYNIPLALRVAGDLDLWALNCGLRGVVRRHEVLRSTYGMHGGTPVQEVQPMALEWLPVVDASVLPSSRRMATVKRLASEEGARPFDLSRGPVLRAFAVRLAADNHVLILNLHHIAGDAWSLGILVRELLALYRTAQTREASPFADLPFQYADFAAWQRHWLADEVLETQLEYWRQTLAGVPPVQLPSDRLPSPPFERRCGVRPVRVDGRQMATVHELCRHQQATPFMALLTAFQATLHRMAGQDDLCVGTPIAGRHRLETENLMGFFVNTLVLRSRCRSTSSFLDFLAAAREATLGAYQNQDVPFEKLVEDLKPERHRGQNPFFQVFFSLQPSPEESLQVPGLRVSALEVRNPEAKFDLTLRLRESDPELLGELEFNADTWDATSVDRLVDHFGNLLHAALKDPTAQVSQLSFLSPRERHQLLTEWGQAPPTAAGHLASRGLHQLFEAQVDRTPHAIAVTAGDRSWSYRELDRQANRLAHQLRSGGLQLDSPVAVATERSIQMVIAILAILKAGGAYLPVDPSHPENYLATLLGEVNPDVILATKASLDRLPVSRQRVDLLDPAHLPSGTSDVARPEAVSGPENLAYLIATSGSTGRPKGVMCPHRAIVNQLRERQSLHPLDATDRFLQLAAFSFEMSAWEIFWPLTTGACLVLAEPGGEKDPKYLSSAVADLAITALRFTPSMLALLLDSPGVERWQHLRHVFTGAESLSPQTMEHYAGRLPGQLHHLYGPTETCVTATRFQSDLNRRHPRVPIGRPMAGALLEVLDAAQQPVAAGSVGELSIGGPGVTRGYFAQPARTAERFVPARRGSCGERVYRTGDRVRWLASGSLDFMGRMDDQVKLRGFRVELGHVESVLREHPQVSDAAVLLRDGTAGQHLVAYIEGQEVASELRVTLRHRLPEYMVPSRFVRMDALPRTRHGKLDRRALPDPEPIADDSAVRLAAPRDQLEEDLVSLWQELLGVEPVGIRQNFFDLGGHSLLAIHLMARIDERFGHSLPVSSLFDHVTVEAQARRLRAAAATSTTAAEASPAIRANGDSAGHLIPITGPAHADPLPSGTLPCFCIHPVGGNVLCYRELGHLLADQPIYAIERRPPLPGQTLAVERLATDYLNLVRAVCPDGPYRLSGWSMGALVAYEMALQLRQAGQEVEWVALFDPPALDRDKDCEHSLVRSPVELLEGFGRDLVGLDYGDIVQKARSHLSRNELLAALETPETVPETVAAIPGIEPQELDLHVLRRLFAVYGANALAMDAYRPAAGLDARLEIFLAVEDGAASPPSARGWPTLALGGHTVKTLAGGHYDLLRRPLVSELAAHLAPLLQERPLKV